MLRWLLAAKPVGAFVATDKKTAARRLIHNATRQTFSGEDPLAVHLVAMSCYDLLREYAETKGIQLKANSLNNVREDVRKSVVDAVKLIHRFSKHARDDADETIDEAKICRHDTFDGHQNV
jgi:hypothetical protein